MQYDIRQVESSGFETANANGRQARSIAHGTNKHNMDGLFGVGYIFLLFLGIALLTVAWKTIKIVPQSTVLLIERLGRFNRVANSGLNIIWPFFEAPRSVYWSSVRPGLTSIDL